MRENRPYGSEGGGTEINQSFLPPIEDWSSARWHDGDKNTHLEMDRTLPLMDEQP